MTRRITLFIPILILILSSCRSGTLIGTSQGTPSQAPTGALTPFRTATPRDVLPTATLKVTMPATPAPTATPFLHTLTNDDTLLGLAFRYGVSLEDLEAANPGIDPHYLSVGKQIVIPLSSEITETLTTPTPIPIEVDRVQCFHAGDGGAWCVAALHNDTPNSLENLSVAIGLYTPAGELVTSEVAYAPLNILRQDDTMPLMAYFAPPFHDDFRVQAQVLSGLLLAADDARYLDLSVSVESIIISQDGRQATLKGSVDIPAGTPSPGELWVLAVAYDENGDIVGARKWKSGGETQFELTVYSLGGEIDHVSVLTEARP